MNASGEFDLLVIGAGPAGCTAAILAARQGWRVRLVEREPFPRFRIGESLLPAGNELLRELGVWPELETRGFVEKRGARFCSAEGRRRKRVDFSKAAVPGLERTFQVERSRFDALLLEQARTCGVTVNIPATVTALTESSDYVTATVRDAAGEESQVTATWVVDAGGREQHYSAPAKRALEPSDWPRRAAVYGHFSGVLRAKGEAAGDTVIVRLKSGWCWLIPIDDTRTSVGIVAEGRLLKQAGDAERFFHRCVAETPVLTHALRNAVPTTPLHTTADYSYFRQQLSTPRVMLAGDAGGFYDPIFSSGVYLAMWSARAAVHRLLAAKPSGRSLTLPERDGYARAVKRHAGVFKRLIEAFYDDRSFEVFMMPRAPLNLGPALTAIVAGHVDLNWNLRWRFEAFLALCAAAKRFRRSPAPVAAPLPGLSKTDQMQAA